MSNRCYLSASEHTGIYPSFSLPEFDTETQWIACGEGCLPLIWIPMFSADDLVTETFSTGGQTLTETAPVVKRETGIERLISRRNFLNTIFERNGGVDHHIDMFTHHVKSVDCTYLSVELQEMTWLYEDGEFQELLQDCLSGLDSGNPSVRDALVTLSTIMLGTLLNRRRFLTLADFESGDHKQKDMWNYFRIMGDSYIRDVPWH